MEENRNFETGAEDTLKFIANTVLVCGLITTVICAATLCFIETSRWGDKAFNPAGFATTVEILIATLATWATLKVFANISITLKEINQKLSISNTDTQIEPSHKTVPETKVEAESIQKKPKTYKVDDFIIYKGITHKITQVLEDDEFVCTSLYDASERILTSKDFE